jgi:hypothetical protein
MNISLKILKNEMIKKKKSNKFLFFLKKKLYHLYKLIQIFV